MTDKPDKTQRTTEDKKVGERDRDRDVAHDDPGAHGTGTDTGPDHSERAWGGDQDIDTAGMVPGNKATNNKEPTGF